MIWYLKDVETGEGYEIADGTIFGRTSGDHLFPKSHLISREHFKIIFENETPYLVDLNSRNGTFINTDKCKPNEKSYLAEDCIITFGEKKLQFRKKQILSTTQIRYEAKKFGT